ncbi:response regulator transcription factor [Limibaculum sp. M0105]|uniref:Response regulator transcription factor n=1 Tax=Thermohalobaculum xanthum TaxID=2753746 RepID=A0A8J7SD31_9RHOB|nr:response regulator transcription factor [Thermohalobaculum xanthum]MBK0398187.1 response regulator transcription factor [Thermohalobaculum xanthum]
MLVDDHPVVRAGYRRLLDGRPGFRVIAEAADTRGALAAFLAHRPDLVLMDISMPGAGGLEAVRAILARQRDARIAVISMHQGAAFALKSLEAGALGYATKSSPPDEMLEVVAAVAAGRRAVSRDIAQEIALDVTAELRNGAVSLSPRETEILRLMGTGARARDIAEALGLSPKTVQNVVSQLRAKLDARSDIDLMRKALAAGLVEL